MWAHALQQWNAERLGECQRFWVVFGVNRERLEGFDHVAAVQVDIGTGRLNRIFGDPSGKLLRKRAFKVAWKLAVEVFAVYGVAVNASGKVGRHTHDWQNNQRSRNIGG